MCIRDSVLTFKSRARVPVAQSVTIENPTDKNWFIAPVLKGDHWHGGAELQVRLGVRLYMMLIPPKMTGLFHGVVTFFSSSKICCDIKYKKRS